MHVSEIGEFGLIKLLTREFGITYPRPKDTEAPAGLDVGIGDDAVVTSQRDAAMIWTTDTMVADNHFRAGSASWRDVGWKALAVNVSDIAAMGGMPHLALVTLTLPSDFEVDDAVDLYRGLHDAAAEYGVTLGGGDIVRAPVFSVTVALSGWATEIGGRPTVLRRDAAVPGDLVAVSGTLGDAAGGVRLLLRGRDFDAMGPSNAQSRLIEAQNCPRPRVALGQAALRAGLRCGMDVSDGLLQDLGHITIASGVAIQVEADRVPISKDLLAVYPDDAVELALTGGEDYELILIGPQETMQKYLAETEKQVTVIGQVSLTPEPSVTALDGRGRPLTFARLGWDHLSTP